MQYNYKKKNPNQEKDVAINFNVYEIGIQFISLSIYEFSLKGSLFYHYWHPNHKPHISFQD